MKSFYHRGHRAHREASGEGDPWRRCSLTAKELKLSYNPQRDFVNDDHV